jgi:hypothetical protein
VVERFLAADLAVDPSLATWAASLGRGSLGRSLGFLPDDGDPGPLELIRQQAFTLIEAALRDDGTSGYAVALGFAPSGARRLVELFAFVEEWLRDLGAFSAGARERVFNRDALDRLEGLIQRSGIAAARVPMALPHVENARELARGNVNPQLIVSGLIRDLRRKLVQTGVVGALP